MARILKEDEYAARRKEILDVAQRLVYIRGYDRVSIQDILDALQISKGAFYHYFDSKTALLEALIERMAQEAGQVLLPLAEDPNLPVLEKINRFFDAAARWKTARKEYLLSLLRVWYADENALLRQKVQAALINNSGPLLAEIIRQGIREGTLTAAFPDQLGVIVLSLMQGLGDAFVELLITRQPQGGDLQRAREAVAAYTDALERVLGAPAGSLKLMDEDTLKAWIHVPGEELETGKELKV